MAPLGDVLFRLKLLSAFMTPLIKSGSTLNLSAALLDYVINIVF